MIVRLGGSDSIRTSPSPEQDAGFELFEGDWVAPNGKGKTSDLQINLTLQSENDVDGAVKAEIRFGNEEDGLLPIMELSAPESLLRYPKSAPEDGYDIKVVRPPYSTPVYGAKVEAAEPVGYFFRIRTRRDASAGKILSAFYGKITAASELHRPSDNPFRLHLYSYNKLGGRFVPRPGVEFCYNLNPNSKDQNLEYDQRNNLAREADEGTVYAP